MVLKKINNIIKIKILQIIKLYNYYFKNLNINKIMNQ
jgi:hypothetical protein